jgi:UDP-glucose 4-epimerase
VRRLDDLSTGDPQALSPDATHSLAATSRPSEAVDAAGRWTASTATAQSPLPGSVLYPREYNAVNVGGTVG